MYLLDTNVISELRKPRPHGAVLQWIGQANSSALFVPAAALGEIQAGIEVTRRQDPVKADGIQAWLESLPLQFSVVPMDAKAFLVWGRLIHRRSDTLREDALIAATAISRGLTVASRNVADFKALGVPVVNPFATPKA